MEDVNDSMIRRAEAKDIDSIVQIHIDTLSIGLTSKLGPRYLKKFYYPKLLSWPGVFSIVYLELDEVVGFAIFTIENKEFLKQIASWSWRELPYFAWAALRHPIILADAWGLMRNKDISTESSPELFMIAVNEKHRGKSVGASLVRYGFKLLQSDYGNASQCVVRTHSALAEAFYLKLGFKKIGVQNRGSFHVAIMTCNNLNMEAKGT